MNLGFFIGNLFFWTSGLILIICNKQCARRVCQIYFDIYKMFRNKSMKPKTENVLMTIERIFLYILGIAFLLITLEPLFKIK